MHALSVIAESWWHFVKATPERRKLMKRRMEVCDTCPNKTQTTGAGKVLVGLLGNDWENNFSCGLCHCPLGALASRKEPGCKAGKWNAII